MEIRTIAPNDYPVQLREIPQVPEQLWIRGALPPIRNELLTVVGSRALTPYGKQACEKLIAELAGYPITIASGLALGVDAVAHRAALSAGLHTIAFPGSGLADNVIAPRTNAGLAREILQAGGALISEYKPDAHPAPWMFPQRNRLMVGISQAVLMIEAGERSGTLITARLAAEYNRELLCVPHRIGDLHGFGAHLFLRLGATPVSEPIHILEALGIPAREEEVREPENLSPEEETMYALLAEPLARSELIRRSNLAPAIAITALVTLELKGYAREAFGAWRRTSRMTVT
ncbi:MAG: DNA-processing protein DprA [Patescibacteria group bacterium]